MTRGKWVEPTIPEKIELLPDLEELEGFEGQLKADGRLDDRTKSLIAMRRHELKTINGWKK